MRNLIIKEAIGILERDMKYPDGETRFTREDVQKIVDTYDEVNNLLIHSLTVAIEIERKKLRRILKTDKIPPAWDSKEELLAFHEDFLKSLFKTLELIDTNFEYKNTRKLFKTRDY